MKNPVLLKSGYGALVMTFFCGFVQAQNIESIPLSDLSVVQQEGTRLHLAPDIAQSMTLAICQKHFPVGSQGRINIQNVVDLINQSPFLGIQINTVEANHWGDKAFACPPPFREAVYIDILSRIPVPNTCGELHDFDATGSVFHWVKDPEYDGKVWAYGDRDQPGFPADHAVVGLRESNFRNYTADPMGNPGNAPSEAIIAHEMGGHLFHMGHPHDRTDEKYKVLESLCNHRSGADGLGLTHDSDKRKPRITAYTRHIFDKLYPPKSNFVDTKDEWVIHDMINRKNHLTPVRAADARHYSYMNPSELQYDPDTGKIMDKKTIRAIWLHCQFSNASKRISQERTVRLTIKILDKVTKDHIVLVKEDIKVENEETKLKSGTTLVTGVDLAQYSFDQHLNTQWEEDDLTALFNSANLELIFEVDPNNMFKEYNEGDNKLVMPITLTKKGGLTSVPMGTVLPFIDPNEATVDNDSDFRFVSAYMDGNNIMMDINFYQKWALNNFAVLFDTIGDGRPDFKVDCDKEGFMLIGKDQSGSLTVDLFKEERMPVILPKRYKFYVGKGLLGLQSGNTLDYWIGNAKEDRVPDTGSYRLTIQ